MALYQQRYQDFGPTLAVEYLCREEGLQVGVETLRQWLLAAGLWQRRRRKPHRLRRPRKEHFGEMSQMDGSYHDWFEGRRDWAVLMVMVDDATSQLYARFFEQETTVAAMEIFRCYVRHPFLSASSAANIVRPVRGLIPASRTTTGANFAPKTFLREVPLTACLRISVSKRWFSSIETRSILVVVAGHPATPFGRYICRLVTPFTRSSPP